MTLDTIVAFDNVVVFVIPLVALLTSWPVMWRKEHLWNFSALKRGPLSNLVTIFPYLKERKQACEATMQSVCVNPFQLLNQSPDFHETRYEKMALEATPTSY
jgi:hypothetical protein